MTPPRFLSVLSLAALVLLTACGSKAVATPPPAQPPPVDSGVPVTGFAPFCQAGTAVSQCTAPTVEERDKFCVRKVPYTLLALPENATFEVLDTGGFSCASEKVRDGKLMVTCTGPELISFRLKVCNPACSAAGLAVGTGQCPQGYGYDASGQCCAAVPAGGETGCIEAKVDLRACPLPQ